MILGGHVVQLSRRCRLFLKSMRIPDPHNNIICKMLIESSFETTLKNTHSNVALKIGLWQIRAWSFQYLENGRVGHK